MSDVKMIQTAKHRWQIVATKSNYVISDNLQLHSLEEASEYIRKYVTSFQSWSYEVIPLKKINLK